MHQYINKLQQTETGNTSLMAKYLVYQTCLYFGHENSFPLSQCTLDNESAVTVGVVTACRFALLRT